jgi:hypothetical protein
VMPLSIDRARGPLVGSVTYRVLCLANSLVLALPALSDVVKPVQQNFSSARAL